MRFQLTAIAEASGGTLHGADVAVEGVGIDSRELASGSLFVPIVAERDGHDFIGSAIDAGAAAYLTSGPLVGEPAVVVPETTAALGVIGRLARQRIECPVLAITGSVGKTTTKDLLAGALGSSRSTHVSYRSFNNELGVPLTLANTPDGAEAVVLEMGARGAGHIALLCEIARPEIGIVLAVGAAHTELFGDLDAVARAKGELIASLPNTGGAILNADDERVSAMAMLTDAEVVTFGNNGDVRARHVRLDDHLRPTFDLTSPWGDARVSLAAAGAHIVTNACAAAASALFIGADLASVVEGLENAEISPLRMDVRRLSSGATLINDAYNANPLSMNAAIDALVEVDAKRRIAVLGVMAELGERSAAEHLLIGERLRDSGIELVAVGAPEYLKGPVGGADSGVRVETVAEALECLQGIDEDVAVLVKGSRVAGLERVVDELLR
ncbi:MAG: UDP-N-acetylmuramoyl-tripeptide--D-alanyl-D-alanine ligase [Acidimicrobiales bacterium]